MEIQLHTFSPTPGSKTRKRRVGRGIGSGMGKTCTRGTKGQKAQLRFTRTSKAAKRRSSEDFR